MAILLCSLFDGIGGFPLAAVRQGIIPVIASEVEAGPISVTKKHIPSMIHLGDITKIDGANITPVDVITFGSPCQDLSVAGGRSGLSGAKSKLFTEAIRIIRQMRHATKGRCPQFAIWENVPGTFSSAGGKDFKTVLEEIAETEIPIPRSGKWAKAGMVRGNGFSIAWRVLDAQYWGVPQRRTRIFLVADLGGQRAGEVLFKPESLPGDFEEGETPGERTAGNIKGGARTAIPVNMQIATRHKALGERTGLGIGKAGDPAFTLQEAHSHAIFLNNIGTDYMTRWDNHAKRIFTANSVSPTFSGSDGGGGRTCAGYLFVVFPTVATSLLAKSNLSYRLDMDNLVVCFGPGGSGDVAHALRAKPSTADKPDSTTYIVHVPIAFSFDSLASNSMKSSNPSSGCRRVHISKTLDTTIPAPLKNQGGIAILYPQAVDALCASGTGMSRPTGQGNELDLVVAYSLQGNMIDRKLENGPRGFGINENISFTLNTIDRGQNIVLVNQYNEHPAEQIHPKVTGTLCASGAGLSRSAGLCNETDLVVAYIAD